MTKILNERVFAVRWHALLRKFFGRHSSLERCPELPVTRYPE